MLMWLPQKGWCVKKAFLFFILVCKITTHSEISLVFTRQTQPFETVDHNHLKRFLLYIIIYYIYIIFCIEKSCVQEADCCFTTLDLIYAFQPHLNRNLSRDSLQKLYFTGEPFFPRCRTFHTWLKFVAASLAGKLWGMRFNITGEEADG